MLWAGAIAIALAFVFVLLGLNARAYTQRANAHWPVDGRIVDAGEARLHVREAGPQGAPRILLIHGASSNLRELWGPLADEFAVLHRVIAYDRPGMGHSTRPKRDGETLALQARMAARVLAQTGDGPAIIVGHSLGAAVSLRLALDHPQLVSGLVLIAPASHPYPGQPAWWARLSSTPVLGDVFCGLIVPWLAPMIAGTSIANNFWPAAVPVNYFEEAGVGLIFRPLAFRSSAQDVVATRREFAAQAPRYADLFTPSIVITAEKDKIVSPKRHARALAADLPAAELIIAPATGHMPHRLRTDLVVAAIRRVNEMTTQAAEG
ncbi:MAG: alpha/beta hydrolase [Hyphomonadaceae bacterium]|nr:alpha/beta hydrolase [Hyphomonadaceae bacterium]MBY0565660.1 alpha/beta hydrolase [Hyphomonadaceae bacterium]